MNSWLHSLVVCLKLSRNTLCLCGGLFCHCSCVRDYVCLSGIGRFKCFQMPTLKSIYCWDGAVISCFQIAHFVYRYFAAFIRDSQYAATIVVCHDYPAALFSLCVVCLSLCLCEHYDYYVYVKIMITHLPCLSPFWFSFFFQNHACHP